MADQHLIKITAELLTKVHQLRPDNSERPDRLENQMAKDTTAARELRLPVMRLADRVAEI